MDMSAVMNIHEIAANKAATRLADAHIKQDKVASATNAQKEKAEEKADNSPLLETYLASSTSVQQKDDPHAVSARVERQVDVQAAKEAVNVQAQNQRLGTLVDIVT
ncbi:hypothetical protein PITCH_A1680006 [uncultured Desulfobacterium sp.]|uniref:Uncharacterized protein n=1 Tax=uncultured Desulfobacterium sp. TaxID=201089 RepID=A0A445MUL6_9BACT|nr:hypothetical protein PITCH_A1680006 [uncultured Desulfobacterium sp.]